MSKQERVHCGFKVDEMDTSYSLNRTAAILSVILLILEIICKKKLPPVNRNESGHSPVLSGVWGGEGIF